MGQLHPTQPEAAAAPAAVPRVQVIARAQGTATDGTIQTSHGVIGVMILHHPPIEGEERTATASNGKSAAVVAATPPNSHGREASNGLAQQ